MVKIFSKICKWGFQNCRGKLSESLQQSSLYQNETFEIIYEWLVRKNVLNDKKKMSKI